MMDLLGSVVAKTVYVDVVEGSMWFLGAIVAITVVCVYRWLWG